MEDKIKYLRKKFNLTRNALAKKVGVSQTSIVLWEKGERSPSMKNIEKLAEVFNVSTSALISSKYVKSSLPTLTLSNGMGKVKSYKLSPKQIEKLESFLQENQIEEENLG